jgi:diguanylate cyclase (GGDEF)-like protein
MVALTSPGIAVLISAIQELSLARSRAEVHRTVKKAARRLTGADGSTLAVRSGDLCVYVEQDGIGPDITGRKMPLGECISGWAIVNRRPAVVDDVRSDNRVGPDGFGPGSATSVVVVPVRSSDPVAAIANYWLGRHPPSAEEVSLLQALADAMSVALEGVAARSLLEEAVRERTAELRRANARLEREIAERRRAEEQIRELSLTDELTGLYNRRGFTVLASQELKVLQRSGGRGLLLYVDLDGLKRTNDSRGHQAGDRLIRRAAVVLRSVARDADIVGRLGGDEFAVLMPLGFNHPPLHSIVDRFLDGAREAGIRWSVGATATVPGRTVALEDLVAGADEAMYRGRRARRAVPGSGGGQRLAAVR